MKKTFTLSSILVAFLFCFSTSVMAQTPSVETGRTGTAYMTSAYVGVPNIAEFWITGQHLKGDITFVGSSTDDPTATYVFQPEKVTKAEAAGYNSMVVRITPQKIGLNTYYVQPISEGLTCEPVEISFVVLDTVPAIVEVSTEPLYGDFYVGETYTREMYIKGNEYIEDSVFFSIPAGSDVVALSCYGVPADSVQATYGYKLFVTFKPSKASASESAKSTFPIVIKTKGMTDYITHEMACHVKAAEPELTVTIGGYGQNVYVNKPFTKTIWIEGNAYLKGDITLTKKNESDNITFSPATITKEDAMRNGGASVDVTITPSVASTERTYFYFTVATEGYTQECSIWCWDVKDQSPVIKLTVENGGYIMREAYKGEPFEVTITARANEFTTDSVYFFSEDSQVTRFEPAAISAEDAKAGKDVIVTIVAAYGSNSAYAKQSFVVKAKTAGAATDAEAIIQFVVLPVETTTALEDVTTKQEATKIIENGCIYILKDGVKYNILGAQVE